MATTTFRNLVLRDGSVLSTSTGSTLALDVTQTLSIDAYSSIDMSNRGFPAGVGPFGPVASGGRESRWVWARCTRGQHLR